jgi:hypothetical protein
MALIEKSVTQTSLADLRQAKTEATQTPANKTSAESVGVVASLAVATHRQSAPVDMRAQLEQQSAVIGDIVKAVAQVVLRVQARQIDASRCAH